MDESTMRAATTLLQDGGSVLIALVAMFAILLVAWRTIILPGMRQQAAMAQMNERAAEQHAIAARSNADTAKANEATSESNAQTACHLQKLTEMLLQSAVDRKKS